MSFKAHFNKDDIVKFGFNDSFLEYVEYIYQNPGNRISRRIDFILKDKNIKVEYFYEKIYLRFNSNIYNIEKECNECVYENSENLLNKCIIYCEKCDTFKKYMNLIEI